MSFTDRLILWLHIAFAIFTIGPVTLAISSTPRYIRRRGVPVLRYLSRITVMFAIASLLVLVFGIVLADLDHDFSHPWLTVSMTLFVVAIVLLVVIVRDQRQAIRAVAGAAPVPDVEPTGAASHAGEASQPGAVPGSAGASPAAHFASVQSGRIAALGGIVNLLWLVILVLMVWRP